jgi:Zn-dependent protease
MTYRIARFVLVWTIALVGPTLLFAAADGEGFAVPWEVKAFVLWLPAMLLGIGLHEWAHAWVAWKLGDSTPEEEGRLSLNPLDHLDPLGAVLIIAGQLTHLPLIGWGKPVMIRPGAFRNPIKDKMKVALAGPMMNLLIAAVTVVLWHLIYVFGEQIIGTLGPEFWVNAQMLFNTMLCTNISLMVFNMLPIPPLDGSKVLENFVTADVVMAMRQIEPYGILIIFALINTPLLRYPYGVVFTGVGLLMTSLALAVGFLGAVLVSWFLMVRSLRRLG